MSYWLLNLKWWIIFRRKKFKIDLCTQLAPVGILNKLNIWLKASLIFMLFCWLSQLVCWLLPNICLFALAVAGCHVSILSFLLPSFHEKVQGWGQFPASTASCEIYESKVRTYINHYPLPNSTSHKRDRVQIQCS